MRRGSVGVAFESIKQDLRQKILAKTWLAGIKIPSSRELAAVYNCSTNTIEKSLKDLQHEGLLLREARRGTFVAEKVFPATEVSVRMLSETVAVVVDNVNSYIFSKAFRGIEDVLKTKGFGLTISSHDNDPERQETIIKGLVQQGIKGIILYPALAFENNSRSYRNLEALLEHASIVCMDRYIYNSNLSIPYVTSDNFYASYQLTRQLIEQGHRQIGFVRNYNVSTIIERLMGYKQALHDFGIPYKNDMDILLHVKNEEVPDFSTEWLGPCIESLRLTAFFTTNYNLAGHVLNGLGKLGLSIPRDISLVSYEVEYMNSFMPIKITGVTQRFYEMGKAAASIIIGLLHNTHESDMTGFICHSLFNPGESIQRLA
jgi:DNA-binding LacI/PurR family transcriptional regulator